MYLSVYIFGLLWEVKVVIYFVVSLHCILISISLKIDLMFNLTTEMIVFILYSISDYNWEVTVNSAAEMIVYCIIFQITIERLK